MSVKSEQIREGRRRLREWLPAAREAIAKTTDQLSMEARSAIGKAQQRFITEDNLDALIIYSAPMGGWHADLVLKNVPPGVANTMGTPVAEPCKTRADAERIGRHLLEMCLVQSQKNREAAATAEPPPPPAFQFHGWDVTLHAELYKTAIGAMPEFAEGYGSEEAALRRLEKITADLTDEGHAMEKLNDWPKDAKARLLAVLHIAALTGVYRYPPSQDVSPSGHRESSTAKH